MKKVELLFLDSGAYSAHTQGVEINIQDYIEYIKNNIDSISQYANLDVIGNAEESYKNQLTMEEAGLKPIPCFHAGEPFEYLRRYLSGSYDYISLGGMVGASKVTLIPFLDRCWEQICDTPDRLPKCKVHGFGITSAEIVSRYPWYSVDSTTWFRSAGLGQILVPKFRSGKYTYTRGPWQVVVSNRSPSIKEEGEHFDTFTPVEQEIITNYVIERGFKFGVSSFRKEDPLTYRIKDNERWCREEGKEEMVEEMVEPGLCNDYKQRLTLNALYFINLEKSLPDWPWPFIVKKNRTFGLNK